MRENRGVIIRTNDAVIFSKHFPPDFQKLESVAFLAPDTPTSTDRFLDLFLFILIRLTFQKVLLFIIDDLHVSCHGTSPAQKRENT